MSPTDAATPPWYRQISPAQWKAFWASWLGYLLDGFDFVIISLVLYEIRDTFNLSLVSGATLISAAFISRWFGGLALGAYADRFGRKNAMIASIMAFSVGSIICALAPAFWVLFTARLLIGAGMAGEYSSSSTYVIESWPVHLRNKASGFLISGFSIGAVLSAQAYRVVVPFGDSIHPNWGWRFMFGLGLLPIALTLWLRRAIPESSDWEAAQAAAKAGARDLAPTMLSTLYGGPRRLVNIATTIFAFAALVLIFAVQVPAWLTAILAVGIAAVFFSYMSQFEGKRWPTGVMVMVVVFTAFLYSWPIQALLPTYLSDPHVGLGLNPERVGDMMFFAGFGAAAGCVVAGFTGDRFGTRTAYWVSLLVSEILVFPVFLVGHHLWAVGILLFFQQMFGQGIAGLLPKWIGGYFAVDKRAAGLGFCYNVGALGGAIAPVLGAALASHMSLGMSLAVLSFGLTAVVIVLIAINAPRQFQRLIAPEHLRDCDGSNILS